MPWHGVPGVPEQFNLWVKRDDLTGLEWSGNKVRKLEFLLAEAAEQGCDCVVTIGALQSNHCRATIAAARAVGLDWCGCVRLLVLFVFVFPSSFVVLLFDLLITHCPIVFYAPGVDVSQSPDS